jgi:AP2 domain
MSGFPRRQFSKTFEEMVATQPRTTRPNRHKPTNAKVCHCGETVFAYTSLCWIAIVDARDGSLLRDYKWTAQGRSLNHAFYARSPRYSRETGKSEFLHHAVTGHVHNELDHANGNGHDNTRCNLRPPNGQNQQNTGKHIHQPPADGLHRSSKYKGVFWDWNCGKWRARIRIDGRPLNLGTYGFQADAAIAYNVHAAYYHGDFARLNRIPIEEYMHD